MPTSERPLRIAWLVYRGNPHCGGQGVYTRYVARELRDLGHHVEVFAGQPWPLLDDGVDLVKVPSLDLYRSSNPFRIPWPWEFRSLVDVKEFAIMCGAGFPEPYTFSERVRKLLANRRDDFDVVHDNQCLGTGLLGVVADGWPILGTLHHPITVDRDLDVQHATSPWRRFTLRRWYGFLDMQMDVARALPRIITVSESSKRDIVAQMGVRPEQLHIVPVGVDPKIFRPMPHIERIPGRLMTTASADVPMKGLAPLLVVIGKPRDKSRTPALIEKLGLTGRVEWVSGVTTERIVELYAEAQAAVVPSLYEGFSLPAIEAMACGVPVVATTGGALPEVVGTDGVTARTVEPNDPEALAGAIRAVLADPVAARAMGEAGRERALSRFTWRKCAEGIVEQYRALLADNATAFTTATGAA
jgi:glycosyltransferase involved in cell wall biosynthesis